MSSVLDKIKTTLRRAYRISDGVATMSLIGAASVSPAKPAMEAPPSFVAQTKTAIPFATIEHTTPEGPVVAGPPPDMQELLKKNGFKLEIKPNETRVSIPARPRGFQLGQER